MIGFIILCILHSCFIIGLIVFLLLIIFGWSTLGSIKETKEIITILGKSKKELVEPIQKKILNDFFKKYRYNNEKIKIKNTIKKDLIIEVLGKDKKERKEKWNEYLKNDNNKFNKLKNKTIKLTYIFIGCFVFSLILCFISGNLLYRYEIRTEKNNNNLNFLNSYYLK